MHTHRVSFRPYVYRFSSYPLQWRHNEHDGVSNHQPHDCLLNGLFKSRSKKTSKLRVTGLCVGNSPVTGEFPAQRASNAENDSIWRRHHVFGLLHRNWSDGMIVHTHVLCSLTLIWWLLVQEAVVQGWGLLSRFPPFRYFPHFSTVSKHTLDIEYHVYIWQLSPQLSCVDTCQIWKWFKESNRYFWKIENFANGEINEQSFSNPRPRARRSDCLPQYHVEWSYLCMPWIAALAPKSSYNKNITKYGTYIAIIH